MTPNNFTNELELIFEQINWIILLGKSTIAVKNSDLKPFTPNINQALCYMSDIPAVHPIRLKFSLEENINDR